MKTGATSGPPRSKKRPNKFATNVQTSRLPFTGEMFLE